MFWTFLFSIANAQPNLAFYPMEDQFSSNSYNPAFLSSPHKFTFSIFPFEATSMGFNNREVITNMAKKFLSGEIENEDVKNVFNSMANQPFFHQNLEISLLSFTFRSKSSFFNFRIKDSEYFLASLGGEVTKSIFNSIIPSHLLNQVQYLPIQSAHYREYSLGYTYHSPSRLFSAGMSTKLYYGKFGFFSNLSGSIQETPQPNQYVLRATGSVNLSFPDNTVENPDGSTNTIELNDSTLSSYLFNTGNPGFGIDLGFRYEVTPQLTFSMSIIDLGKINWKKNLKSRKLEEEYPLPINDFPTKSSETSTFTKPLPITLYGGLKYQLNPRLSLHLVDRHVFVKDLNYNSISIAANLGVNKNLSVSTGYSIIADSYLNIPLAFLFKWSYGQFFIGTDNITSILLPSYAEYAGISLGACFYPFKERNLYLKPSDLTPFYQPRKVIKRRNKGLIINPGAK